MDHTKRETVSFRRSKAKVKAKAPAKAALSPFGRRFVARARPQKQPPAEVLTPLRLLVVEAAPHVAVAVLKVRRPAPRQRAGRGAALLAALIVSKNSVITDSSSSPESVLTGAATAARGVVAVDCTPFYITIRPSVNIYTVFYCVDIRAATAAHEDRLVLVCSQKMMNSARNVSQRQKRKVKNDGRANLLPGSPASRR